MERINLKAILLSTKFQVTFLVCFILITILYLLGMVRKYEFLYNTWQVLLVMGVLLRILERREKLKNNG